MFHVCSFRVDPPLLLHIFPSLLSILYSYFIIIIFLIIIFLIVMFLFIILHRNYCHIIVNFILNKSHKSYIGIYCSFSHQGNVQFPQQLATRMGWTRSLESPTGRRIGHIGDTSLRVGSCPPVETKGC